MQLAKPSSALQSSPEALKYYLEHSLSTNTQRAYRTDLEHFLNWGGSIPCQPDQVADYLTFHAASFAIATLQRRIISIRKAHRMRNLPDPTKNELIHLTMRGIMRVHGKPQSQVSPILKDYLIVMLSKVPETPKGQRDKALLILGFCGALRRSELVAINIEDLEFTSQGIILTVPRSKTDQSGQGRKIGIPKGRGRICPVGLVASWLKTLSANSGPLFRSVAKGGSIALGRLSSRSVADIIKHYAGNAGLNAVNYSGHSLRSGLATSAAQNGAASWKIRAQTGHKSDAMLARYIRDGDLFNGNAAALF